MTLGWTQSGITGPIAADASENLVWAMGGGTLYGLNATTGAIVAQHAVTRDGAQHFPTPAVVPNWVVVESQKSVAGFTTPNASIPAKAWVSPPLDELIQARPLVVGNIVVVATEGDSLYGLNLADGTIAWGGTAATPTTHFGTAAKLSEVRQVAGVGACGDIDPLGATSNPVLSSDGTTVYAVGERETGTVTPHPPEHVLVGVNPATGAITLTPKNVDVSAMGDVHGVARHQQRAGLAVGNGNVYVGFGGLVGDCGVYHGFVVAASQSDGHVVGSFEAAAASNAAAVWGTSGPIVDPSTGNVYATTGNSFNAPNPGTDYSDAVVQLPSGMTTALTTPSDYFQPPAWRSDNNADLDLGSTGPVFASSTQLFVIGKQHDAFLLNLSPLGGADHNTPAGTINVCPGVAMGQNAVLGSSAYVACSNGIRQVHLG
jgi:hypothetical protein